MSIVCVSIQRPVIKICDGCDGHGPKLREEGEKGRDKGEGRKKKPPPPPAGQCSRFQIKHIPIINSFKFTSPSTNELIHP